MSNQAARRASWSRYWAGGHLHSCAGSFDGNYDGAIGAFWRSVFASLSHQDRVLDIATGNAPLPQLLLSARAADPASLPRVDAVDLAEVNPAWLARLMPPVRERLRVPGDSIEHFKNAKAVGASHVIFDRVQKVFDTGVGLACLRFVFRHIN